MFTVSRIGPHQPGQHRAGDRLLVELRGGALDLDRDRADVLADDLPDQIAELLGERHVGLEARRFLGGQRRHVDRVGHPAEQQEVAHLLGDLDRDVDLRLAGRGAEVRGRDEIGRAEQGRRGGRLAFEHVERAPATWPLSSASLSAASSISPPRAQLTIRTPGLVLANASR